MPPHDPFPLRCPDHWRPCVLALAAGAVDVKDLTLREKALWDENNHLREFAEINYTGETRAEVRGRDMRTAHVLLPGPDACK